MRRIPKISLRKLKAGDFLLVEWIDAGRPSIVWELPENITADDTRIVSAGWYCGVSGECMVIASDYHPAAGEYSPATQIPVASVKRVLKIKLKRAARRS